jgi:hypothetical protein
MQPADPNILLSTTAQATAVLVAIVGGFLVSRLVALSSERAALIQRDEEIEAALERTEERWTEVHNDRFAVSRRWFIEHHMDAFIEARGVVDIDSAVRSFIPRGSSEGEMRPVAEELADRITKALQEISGAFQGAEFPSGEIEHLRQRIPEIADEDVPIYQRLGAILRDERRASLGYKGFKFPSVRPFSIKPDITYQRQDARIRDEEDLQAELTALRHELDLVRKQLRRFGRPEGVGVGVTALVFFSLLGIAFPMIVMSLRPVPDGQGMRFAAISTFLFGLVVLLGYVAWLVRKLRPPEP